MKGGSTECRAGGVRTQEFKFERLGVFAYSEEDGTPAASMDEQLVATAAAADAVASLTTVLRIMRNVLARPRDARFRRLRWSNAALRDRVQRFPPAVALLRIAGFTVRPAGSGSDGKVANRESSITIRNFSHRCRPPGGVSWATARHGDWGGTVAQRRGGSEHVPGSLLSLLLG